MLLLGKSVLDGDIFPSIQPSLLSSCRNASRRSALPEAVLIQETDAEDFPCLLRVGAGPEQ